MLDHTESLQAAFESIGGTFLMPAGEMAERLQNLKGIVFDWDGVFNSGIKTPDKRSPFAEPDAMGTNMFRFNYWLENRTHPYALILTGGHNPSALEFCIREHFQAAFLGFKYKHEALTLMRDKYGLAPSELAFVFDDVLDLEVARQAGLALCVRTTAKPLFNDYLIRRGIGAYLSGHGGGAQGLREIMELLIGLRGNYDSAITHRSKYSQEYQTYLEERNSQATEAIRAQQP